MQATIKTKSGAVFTGELVQSVPMIEVYRPHGIYGWRAVIRLSEKAIEVIKHGAKSIVLELEDPPDNGGYLAASDINRFYDYTRGYLDKDTLSCTFGTIRE